MPRCLIGLGSNLGNRESNLRLAVEQFDRLPNVSVDSVSQWFGTDPVGGPAGQRAFLNGAATLETTLTPTELLQTLRGIEESLGRERRIRWDARTIDTDILLFDDECLDSSELTIPHPRMICRRFVLEPAAQIAANWIHPSQHWTVGKLFEHLISAAPRFVLCGFDRAELRPAAEQITTQPNVAEFMRIDSLQDIERAFSWSPKLFIIPTNIGTTTERAAVEMIKNTLVERRIAPVLTITNLDPAVVVAETVAAMEAMK